MCVCTRVCVPSVSPQCQQRRVQSIGRTLKQCAYVCACVCVCVITVHSARYMERRVSCSRSRYGWYGGSLHCTTRTLRTTGHCGIRHTHILHRCRYVCACVCVCMCAWHPSRCATRTHSIAADVCARLYVCVCVCVCVCLSVCAYVCVYHIAACALYGSVFVSVCGS